MKELLMNYTVEQIILFLIILATAIKGTVSFFDWAKDRLVKKFKQDDHENELEEKITKLIKESDKQVQDILERQDQILNKINDLSSTVQLLINSDKDDIKAWITERHHLFCYEKKSIDDYNLDCIEKRYTHYVDEGGNSFVADLMKDIRSLPKNNK